MRLLFDKVILAAILLASFGAHAADEAASYPNKPIRVVIGFSAGGVVDVSARIIALALYAKMPYDTLKDFAGVTMTVTCRSKAYPKR